MLENSHPVDLGQPARLDLKPYTGELPLGSLVVGVDNIHHDVYLSPKWTEQTRTYLLELLRQVTNLTSIAQNNPVKEPRPARGTVKGPSKGPKGPEHGAWKRQLLELLQASLTNAKYGKKIENDLLLRVAVVKFLSQEIGNQFSNLLLEAKEWIRNRGEYYERSEQAHVMKARLAELQANRRNIFCEVGQHVYQVLAELEETHMARARRALFGDEQAAAYDLLLNRIAFVEGGRNDALFLEHYVLLGNYARDQDRFELVDPLLLDLLREAVRVEDSGGQISEAAKTYRELVDSALETRAELATLEQERTALLRRLDRGGGVFARVGIGAGTGELRTTLADVERRLKNAQGRLEDMGPRIETAKAKSDFLAQEYHNRLGDFLNEPENARRLFDPHAPGGENPATVAARVRLLDEWLARLTDRDMLVHVLASYELRNIHHDYCPPIHLQQLKKGLVSREEFERVAVILKQFPARNFSLERIETLAKKLRRYPREEARAVAARFAEDFMRLRRDLRNLEVINAAMERIQLVRNEQTRELSRMNNSLYEYLLPTEARPVQDNVVNHAVIKADVRGSTRITRELLDRGLNPATLFSLRFYEPVKKILDQYGAAKVFIEGDAMVLAIFETEANRSRQRAVSKACALARQILAISAMYNDNPDLSELPRLELGVGIAFQPSAPTYWVDSDSRIMISRALNLSDRLSSCSKLARRLLADKISLFRLFVFQPALQGAEEDEIDEYLIRFNLNGVELNDEGFAKLSEEIALHTVEAECEMPWGRELTTFYYGEAPIGEGVEPILLRQGDVRQIHSDGTIGLPGHRKYYEVCTHPKVFEMIEALLFAMSKRGERTSTP
jgi:hypothetical protein